jgi:hypothetical protein
MWCPYNNVRPNLLKSFSGRSFSQKPLGSGVAGLLHMRHAMPCPYMTVVFTTSNGLSLFAERQM